MKVKRRYVVELLIIIVCIFLAYFYLIYSSDFIKTMRYKCNDLLFEISSRVSQPDVFKDKITIIAIDEKSLAQLKLKLPLKRSFITKIIKKLRKYDPELIFLNFLLSEESYAQGDNDLIFAAAIKKAQNVVLPVYYDTVGNRLGPLNVFEKVSYRVGFINKVRDWDSSIRKCMLFHLSTEGKIDEYALELAIASEVRAVSENSIIFKKSLSGKVSGYREIYENGFYRIPIERDGSMYINYKVRPDQFSTVSLVDFMKGRLSGGYLKDRIVIAADVTEAGGSVYNTPLGLIPGIYVFANELTMLLSDKYIQPIGAGWLMVMAFLLMLSIGYTTFKFNTNRSFVMFLAIGAFVFILSYLFFRKGFIVDYFSVIFPMAGIFIFTSFFRFLVLLEEKVEELKEANIRIREAQQELIKKEQLSTIGKMTAKILHEIKGPLANIKSCFEIINAGIKDDVKSKRIAQLAGDEINRMLELSQQLRESYTPHSEDLRAVDINNLLYDAIEISNKRFIDKGVEVVIKLDKDIPTVKVSSLKIKQVFVNILNNAFEAVSRGGKVEVYSRGLIIDDKNNVSIAFKNNGPVIPKEDCQKIFDAFYSTKKDIQGSGLGLFICREIIKAHNGDITVVSNENTGAVFTVLLPVD